MLGATGKELNRRQALLLRTLSDWGTHTHWVTNVVTALIQNVTVSWEAPASLPLCLYKVTFIGLHLQPSEVLMNECYIFNKHLVCSHFLPHFLLSPRPWSRGQVWILVLPLTNCMNLGKSLNSGNLRAWLSLLLHLGGMAVKSSRGHSPEGTSATPGQGPVLRECTCWVSVRTQGWRKYFYIFYDSVSDSRLPFLWATSPQQKIIFIWGPVGAVIGGVFLVTFHTCDCSCLFDLFRSGGSFSFLCHTSSVGVFCELTHFPSSR